MRTMKSMAIEQSSAFSGIVNLNTNMNLRSSLYLVFYRYRFHLLDQPEFMQLYKSWRRAL